MLLCMPTVSADTFDYWREDTTNVWTKINLTNGESLIINIGNTTDTQTSNADNTLGADIEHFYTFTGDATDSVGVKDGTNNGATLIADRHGNSNNAYDFVKTESDYIDIGFGILSGKTTGTFSTWIKKRSTAGEHDYLTAFNVTEGATGWLNAHITYTQYTYFQNYADNYDVTAYLDITNWHNIITTWNGTDTITWIDGVQAHTETASTNAVPWVSASIGRKGNDDVGYFDGYIDDVRIYSRGITYSEMQSIYISTEPTISCTNNVCNITANSDLTDYQVKLTTSLTGDLNLNNDTGIPPTAQNGTINLFLKDEITNATIVYDTGGYGYYSEIENIKTVKYLNYSSGNTGILMCDTSTTTYSENTGTGDSGTCLIGLNLRNNTIYYKYSDSQSNSVVQTYNYLTSAWETKVTGTGGESTFIIDNTNGEYSQNNIGKIRFYKSTGSSPGLKAYYVFNYDDYGNYNTVPYNTTDDTTTIKFKDLLGVYSERQLYFDTNSETQNITGYILKLSESVYSCYTLISSFGLPIKDAVVSFYNDDTLITQQHTDSGGKIQLYLNPYTQYNIQATSTSKGFKDFGVSQPPTIACDMLVFGQVLNIDYTNDFNNMIIDIQPNKYLWTNQNALYNINIKSLFTNNTILSYGANITYLNDTVINSSYTTNVSLLEIDYTISEDISDLGIFKLKVYFTTNDTGDTPYLITALFTKAELTVQNYTVYNILTQFEDETTGTGLNSNQVGGIFLIIILSVVISTAGLGLMSLFIVLMVSVVTVIFGFVELNTFIIIALIVTVIILGGRG